MRWNSTGAGIAILMVTLGGCGAAKTPYARIHDAALDLDGGAIVLLVESGDSSTSGSIFSGSTTYTARRLALWRLDRASGALREADPLALPAGFQPNRAGLRLAQFAVAAGEVREGLPDCRAALTLCAVRRAPEPYVAEDLAGGLSRGLQVIDPLRGHRVRTDGVTPSVRPWPHRTAQQLDAARNTALRASVQAVRSAALRRLASLDAAPDQGAADRGTTFIDDSVGTTLEGLMPDYRLAPDGAIYARLQYGGDPPVSLRWTRAAKAATYDCQYDVLAASAWAPDCRPVVELQALNPELAYLASVLPRLRDEARRDPTYQSARRGTTFGLRVADAANELSWVGCLGVPGSRVGDCDPRQGDSVCSLQLPLLCLLPDAPGTATAGEIRGPDGRSDPRWLAARVATAAPVRGDELVSAAAASARCAADLGAGWRIASWSDHGDGFIARGVVRGASRAWIDVPGVSAANCWASPAG